MESNHFDPTNVSGCPGQQFSDSFVSARGSVCCRNTWFYLTRGIALLPIGVLGLAAGLMGLCVCLPGLVVTVPLMIYKRIHAKNWDLDILFLPSYLLLGLCACIFLFLAQIVWFPIALLTCVCYIAFTTESEEFWIYFWLPSLAATILIGEDD